MNKLPALLIIFTLTLLSACAADKVLSDKQYLEHAKQAMDTQTYDLAIDNYQKLLEEYPFSAEAEEAQLAIGKAQYLNKQYTEAIASFQDFQRMHPTSPNLPFSEYHMALAYFDQMGKRDRDQRAAENAEAHLRAVIDRYPESEYAVQAKEKLNAVRELLADHDLAIAKFYLLWLNPVGAEARLRQVIENYPDTDVAAAGLVYFGNYFRKRGDLQRAALAYATVVEQYPKAKDLPEARDKLALLRAAHIEVPETPLPALAETLGRPSRAVAAAEPAATQPAAKN